MWTETESTFTLGIYIFGNKRKKNAVKNPHENLSRYCLLTFSDVSVDYKCAKCRYNSQNITRVTQTLTMCAPQ